MPVRPAALIICLAPFATGLARVADKQALIDLFTLLGGPHWFNNDGWDPDGGADPCTLENRWFGVGCIDPCDIYRDGPSCAFGRITALNLRDNNLTGSLTNWTGVGQLHNLSWIDLSVNAISGSVPAEIGNVQNVEVLNMAWNSLEGGLPSTLGALNSNGYAQINELGFEYNQLEGTLPSELGLLTKLRMFNFHHNRISGSIPVELTNLTDMQVMYVSGNRLIGELPEEMGKLSVRRQQQSTHHSPFTTPLHSTPLNSPHSFPLSQALRFLNASENNISGTVPPSIGNLNVLNDLSLFSNSISGSLPLELGSIAPLRYLRMQDNRRTHMHACMRSVCCVR